MSVPSRLETFSDAVVAVIITIMVLELKPPHETTLTALTLLFPSFLTYAFSFQTIGTYWNNHHHLLRLVKKIDFGIMWSNLHFLFWLSLIPFFTAWLGENYLSPWPASLYGGILLMCGIAYEMLQKRILLHHGSDSSLAKNIGNNIKGKLSVGAYITAIFLAFVHPFIAEFIYLLVAIFWFIPDRRLEITRSR